jgi:hypothetical protein
MGVAEFTAARNVTNTLSDTIKFRVKITLRGGMTSYNSNRYFLGFPLNIPFILGFTTIEFK